jgi:secondary thiamine-phosphate synthase enzyme
MTLKIKTLKKRDVVDITDKIEVALEGSGLVNIFVKHTTAALTTADLDPGTDIDLLDAIENMTPKGLWRHPHDPSHFPDHLWASLIGPTLMVPYIQGKLSLGTWQRIILIELDGPRDRYVEVNILVAKND